MFPLDCRRRCDKLIFMSTEEELELGAVNLPRWNSTQFYNITSGRASLWNKTKKVKMV